MAGLEGDKLLHGFMAAGNEGGTPDAHMVKRALQAIRSHLGMEVAYVSEFVDGRSVFHRGCARQGSADQARRLAFAG